MTMGEVGYMIRSVSERGISCMDIHNTEHTGFLGVPCSAPSLTRFGSPLFSPSFPVFSQNLTDPHLCMSMSGETFGREGIYLQGRVMSSGKKIRSEIPERMRKQLGALCYVTVAIAGKKLVNPNDHQEAEEKLTVMMVTWMKGNTDLGEVVREVLCTVMGRVRLVTVFTDGVEKGRIKVEPYKAWSEADYFVVVEKCAQRIHGVEEQI